MSKISAYVGFAIKSNAIIKGLDDIVKTRKRIGVILYSSDLNMNSETKLQSFVNLKNINIIKLSKESFDELNLVGVKIVAITDPNLSLAIKNLKI